MKKVFVVFLAFTLLLCAGCAKEEPAPTETVPETTVPETTVPETTEETIPVPELEYGTAKVNGVPAILDTLSRGDIVDVVDNYDEYHVVVKTAEGYGLVEKHLIRMSTEPEYEAWTGYAAWNAAIYDNYNLSGEPIKKANTNGKVEVLDDLGHCCLVQYEDITGYMAEELLSKTPRSYGSGGDSGGGGGGGGGGAPAGGQDGGDISLQFQGGFTRLAYVTPQEGSASGQAKVLADGTEVLLGYFDHGDSIPVVAEKGFAEDKEGYYAVFLVDLYAYVPTELVHMEGDELYEEWNGYSKYNAVMYEDQYLSRSPSDKLKTNTEVKVLQELENSYCVEVEGMFGYMEKKSVNKYRYTAGGGGDSGGGGGGGGGGAPAPEWSPPAL